MNATQHTPGPWKIDRMAYPNSNDVMVREDNDGDEARVARVLVSSPEIRDGEGLANARLIAAAPDLLWALQCCDSAMSAIAVGHAPPASFQNILADARAAIAKATGGVQ